MKISFAMLFIIFQTSVLFGQVAKVDKCGLDDNPKLNSFEGEYFNEVFKNKKGEFDFSGKVIAFFTGSLGKTKITKADYFSSLKSTNSNSEINVHTWQANGTQLLLLSDNEKKLSGGYDAILVSWSKLTKQGKAREKLIRKLKNTL